MIQAQTGIGKTYGYCFLLLAQSDVDKVVVAVPTKLLQNQIMNQEAKVLSDVFNILSVVSKDLRIISNGMHSPNHTSSG